ncbi:Uncharacterised protein [Legionella busanensis]|uniref:Uncharacterized protein n=1 Tax=Legionella busanensis TaxID=190655 RepID=A0A378JH14_9GAMM|nr:hypothetical protein [Legionella busanensis]STX50475.1 Uncharacterised protein [Legionella busanensis]
MLISEIVKSVNKLQEFSNTTIETKKNLDSLLLANNISIDSHILADFKMIEGIKDTLSWLKKYEIQALKKQQLSFNLTDIPPFSLASVPLKQQEPKKERPIQVNIFPKIISEDSLNKNSDTKKLKEENEEIKEKGVIQKQCDMLTTIDKLIAEAATKNIIINKNKMPGTKAEFVNILKHIAPEHFTQSLARLSKYFTKMKLKFQRGRPSKPCSTIKQLRDLVGLK